MLSAFAEFAGTLDYLLAHPQTAAQLGRQGRQYVLENFQWDTIIAAYSKLIEQLSR